MFQLDESSLLWFRRALCFCWGWTLLVKLSDLSAHYTDEGILPRALLSGQPWKLSLNFLSGKFEWQVLIFVIALLATLACALYRSSFISALVMWLTGISILSRNELILNGADHYFSMLLIWNVIFLSPVSGKARSLGYTIQISALYLFTALAKLHFEPWRDGSAVHDILYLDILTRPWSQDLIQYGFLTRLMTWTAVGVELLAPIGLILGLMHLRLRAFVICILALLHFGILVLLKLYFIPITSLISLIPFIPKSWWQAKVWNAIEKPQKPADVLVGLLVVVILAWNIHNLPEHPFPLPETFKAVTASVRLDQDWSFYAPPPTPGFNGWWVIQGITEGGDQVDPWNLVRQAPDRSKPAVLSDYYPNQHWTAYFINIGDNKVRPLIHGLLEYLCVRWERNFGLERLTRISLDRVYSIYNNDNQILFSMDHNCRSLVVNSQ